MWFSIKFHFVQFRFVREKKTFIYAKKKKKRDEEQGRRVAGTAGLGGDKIFA